ncbi:ataxin-10 [Schistocerca cancellata]|uniref:ataxin-10 n=1 Tax=Schistocerca cancellata TaxID=274614 RepID=UPI002119240D|nr:ataxin-10 [Schistocerca cancellata]
MSEDERKEGLLDVEGLKTDLDNQCLDSVYAKLDSTARAFASEHTRSNVPPLILDALMDVVHIGVDLIKSEKDGTAKVLTESFRTLRNACAGQVNTQNKLGSNKTLLEDTVKILEFAYASADEQWIPCLQIGIQFLGNLIVKNEENQLRIWKKFSVLLLKFLQHENQKVASYSSMVIYNVLLGHNQISEDIDAAGLEIIIDRAINDCEFASFIADMLVRTEGYLQSVYKELQYKPRLFVLDAVFEAVGCKPGEIDEPVKLPTIQPDTILFLAEEFKRRSFFILKTVDKYVDEIEPLEVAKLLEVIASASGKSPYLEELQKDKSLLIDCTFLLKSMHSLGQDGDNNFSVIQSLSQLNLKGKDTALQQHPAFGFKVDLVRLMGNLCWKHKENQHQVVELEGVQLLLDCCKIDARNPFVMQWAILALRNLCEDNKECQEVIAGMTKKGEIDATTLNQVGLTLHSGPDGGVGIAPLPR